MSNASIAVNDTKRSTQSSLAAAMLSSDLANPPLPVSPLEESDDYNDIGIPVVLLWLPYTTLSLVLIGLMAVSFIRFHFKHGHKYRRRREQFWRELNVQDILRGAQTQSDQHPRGMPRPTDRIDGLPPGSNIPPQFAWTDTIRGDDDIYREKNHPTSPQGGATDTGSSSARHQMAALDARRHPKMSLAEAESSLRRSRSLLERFRSSVYSRKWRRTRLPVAFCSNLNGSMVNIRCGEKESLSTFQTASGLSLGSNSVPRQPSRHGQVTSGHAQRKPDIWTVQGGYKPKMLSGTFGSSNSAVAIDEVSLITQTLL